jgi:hypothetical protein
VVTTAIRLAGKERTRAKTLDGVYKGLKNAAYDRVRAKKSLNPDVWFADYKKEDNRDWKAICDALEITDNDIRNLIIKAMRDYETRMRLK